MKKFILLIECFILALFNINAQDKFYSYSDMAGKRVILYNQTEILNRYEPYVYQYNDRNKLKVIKNPDFYKQLDKSIVYVVGLETLGKRKYIHLIKDEEDYYVIMDGRLEFLNSVRPTNIEQFVEITNKYSYLDLTSTIATQSSYITRNAKTRFPILERYLPIYWEPYSIPETIVDDFTISFKLEERGPEIPLTYSQCTSYNGFITQEELDERVEEYNEAKRIQEIQDSIDVYTIVEARILDFSESEKRLKDSDIINYLEKGDTIYVSIYGYDASSYTYSGIVDGKTVLFPSYLLKFEDPNMEEFIKLRGEYNTMKRKEIARDNDRKRSAERRPRVIAYYQQQADKAKKSLETLDNFIHKKQLFIESFGLIYSEYSYVGVRFSIYNCFNKPIKYVDLKLAAYNSVDDRIGDYKKIQGIGWIYQKDTGTYNFEEVFYDRNDIIHKIEIVEIKLTFKDNTVLTYSGTNKVKSHMQKTYSKELLEILEY